MRTGQPTTYRRIGLWGHYHGGNQGDECVVTALMQNIRRRLPESEIVGFSLNPADTRRRHGIEAYPIQLSAEATRSGPRAASPTAKVEAGAVRRMVGRVPPLRVLGRWVERTLDLVRNVVRETGFLKRSYDRLKGTDLLIVAGSGQLCDHWPGGPWSHPYAVFKWALLCRLTGTRFVPLNVGAGPIRHRLSRFFLGRAVRWATYCSFRDRHSAELIEALGVPVGNPVLPDLAFSLELPRPTRPAAFPGLVRGNGIVALNPLPHHDGRYLSTDDDRPGYERYLGKLVDFGAWLFRNGYSVVLVSTQLNADPRVCEDIERVLRSRPDLPSNGRLARPSIATFDDLVEVFSACDYVLAARFHGIIVPLLLGKPVVAMAYHPKTAALMGYMGQAEFCLDIEGFTTDQVVDRFLRLVARRESAVEEARRRIPGHRAALEAQYDRLLGPVVETVPATLGA